jgi:hypothetical protein
VVRFTAFAGGRLGGVVRAESGRVQTYFAVALTGFLLVLVWLLVA